MEALLTKFIIVGNKTLKPGLKILRRAETGTCKNYIFIWIKSMDKIKERE